jgi:hypothetical protein
MRSQWARWTDRNAKDLGQTCSVVRDDHIDTDFRAEVGLRETPAKAAKPGQIWVMKWPCGLRDIG